MARTVGKHEAPPKKEEVLQEQDYDWTPSHEAEPAPKKEKKAKKERRSHLRAEDSFEPDAVSSEDDLEWEAGWEPEGERRERSLPGWIKAIRTVAILLVVVALLLLGADVLQRGRFAGKTDINGVSVARMNADEASSQLTNALQLDKVITLTDPEGNQVGQLRLADLLRGGDLTAEVEKLLQQQHSRFLPLAFFGQGGASYSLGWLDQSSIESLLAGALGNYGYTEATASQLKQGENGWELIPAKNGTAPDVSAAAASLSAALNGSSLADAGQMSLPIPTKETVAPVTDEDQTRRAQIDAIEAALSKSVFIDFGDDIVVELTRADLAAAYHVELTDTGAEVTLDKDALAAVLDDVIARSHADGIDRKYQTIDRLGAELHYNDWDTGWTLKRETLLKDVIALLEGEGGTATAGYNYVASVKKHFANGNNSFIEIDLSNQYLWFYRKGVLVLSTPIVSGSVANGTETPRGAFSVSYKQKNAKLAGPGYSYTVDYWIPFYGNIGIHNAPWRTTDFGGDVYLGADGSHGCVEVPEDIIEAIFQNASTYIPVFVY